jgi:hypothetical protein
VVVGEFFVADLANDSVSAFNIGPWLVVLLTVTGVLGGGVALQGRGRGGAAKLLLAVPGVLFVLFFGLLILVNPRRN